MLFEEFFSEDDIKLVLECISDIRCVSCSNKHKAYIDKNENIFDVIVNKMLLFFKNKEFFSSWSFYEASTKLKEEERNLIIKALDIVLDIHPDSELSTYVGYDRGFIVSAKTKFENYSS